MGPFIRFQAVSWTLGFMPKAWGYETLGWRGVWCTLPSSLGLGLEWFRASSCRAAGFVSLLRRTASTKPTTRNRGASIIIYTILGVPSIVCAKTLFQND